MRLLSLTRGLLFCVRSASGHWEHWNKIDRAPAPYTYSLISSSSSHLASVWLTVVSMANLLFFTQRMPILCYGTPLVTVSSSICPTIIGKAETMYEVQCEVLVSQG